MSDCSTKFPENSSAGQLYKSLAIGDPCLMDNGYDKTDYDNKTRIRVGKGDKIIEAREVIDYGLERTSEAFANYEKSGNTTEKKKFFEEYQKHLQTFEKTTGYQITWALNDFNPETKFDDEINTKIESFITFLNQELNKAGYQKGTDKFNELMALSLFAFTSFPKVEQGAFAIPKKEYEKTKNLMESVVLELQQSNLSNIVDNLVKNGGLGRFTVMEFCESAFTASKALENNCGACLEESQILYAILKKAGLPVKPVHAESKLLDDKTNHSSIALVLRNKKRIFDIAQLSSNAEASYSKEFDWYYEISESEFIASYHSNRGSFYLFKNQANLAIEQYKKGKELCPDDYAIRFNLGFTFFLVKEAGQAITEFREASSLYPKNPQAHYCLAQAYFLKIGQLKNKLKTQGAATSLTTYGLSVSAFLSSLDSDIEEIKKLYNQALSELKKASSLGYKDDTDQLEKTKMLVEDLINISSNEELLNILLENKYK